MSARTVSGAAALAFSLTAGAATADGYRQITSRDHFLSVVTDRALQIPLYGVDLRVSPDGRISGKGGGRSVSGQWQWTGDYFCRDLYWGERNLGANCQEVAVSGGKVRFTSDRGQGRSAEFRLR